MISDYPKKQQVRLRREMDKILRNLGGIRNMTKMPDIMVIVDSQTEKNAINEALQLNIPTIGVVDTDSDPDFLDIIIPANDDSFRSIEIILELLADAIQDGMKEYKGKVGAQAKLREEEAPAMRREITKKPRTPRRKTKTVEAPKEDAEKEVKPVEEKPSADKPLR
ncbi:MAG: 30S ribosomal protein S2, partial [Planctomycetes bacterium]|nr:30S ribosomal protein S2 [Planctomycetota bacterium]